MNEINIVGEIRFGGHYLNVYGDLDEPLFKASEVAKLIDYSNGNTWNMLELCEQDEYVTLPIVVPHAVGRQRKTHTVAFVTELGLYNILSQSRKPIARGWRRIVHEELIAMRRHKELNITQQFEEWDHALDDIYFDDETGILMQSVTVHGGDVEQIPFE